MLLPICGIDPADARRDLAALDTGALLCYFGTLNQTLRAAAFLITLGASVAMWSAYFYEGTAETTETGGVTVTSRPLSLPLIDRNKPARVALVLSIPLVFCLVPLVFPKLTRHAAIALALFTVIGEMGIGLYYLPSTVLLFLAWRRLRMNSGTFPVSGLPG